MEKEIRVMNGDDISLSNDFGNIVELSDFNDTLGLDMISNTRLNSGSGSRSSSSSSSSSSPPMPNMGISEVQVSHLDSGPSFLMPEISVSPFQAEIKREDSTFSNFQSSTPSIHLDPAPPRMSNEAEKKEKMEYINKLQRLEQKGFPVSRRYTMDNTLEEVRDEYNRLLDARNLEASLRFQRQALMGIVTGLEWANGKFDPFELKLDGWSESVHENVEDFDEIFEELYDKYKERGKMPPEARLMVALAGSGFMCHVSNTFLRSRMPNVDDVLRNNPDLARQVAGAAASQAGPGFGNFMNMAMNSGKAAASPLPTSAANQMFNAPPNAPQNIAAVEPPTNQVRREMKGPSGVDDILKTFEDARKNDIYMAPESVSSVNQPAMAAAVELQSIHSEEVMSQAESTRTGGGRGGGRRRRMPVGNSVSLSV
jgi:hypothetical protein